MKGNPTNSKEQMLLNLAKICLSLGMFQVKWEATRPCPEINEIINWFVITFFGPLCVAKNSLCITEKILKPT